MDVNVSTYAAPRPAASVPVFALLLAACQLTVAFTGPACCQDVFGRPGELPRPAPVIPLATGVENRPSISVSKQFVVHGKSLALRSAFSAFAESVKGDFLDLLYRTGRGVHLERIDAWQNQIVIQVRDDAVGPDERTVLTRIRRVVPEGFRIELSVKTGNGIDRDELRQELIRVLLAESILRDHKTVRTGGRSELLPAWLLAGVSEILRQKAVGRPSERYERVFASGSIMSVDEIMQVDPARLDSVSLKIYELSCAGMIQTLLDQVSGSNRMRAYLSELAVFSGPQRDLLLKHFPGLRVSRNSLEKWWALQMATMSKPGVFELMTPEETELALTEALIVKFKEAEGQGAGAEGGQGAEESREPALSLGKRVLRWFGGASARQAAPGLDASGAGAGPAPSSAGGEPAAGDEETDAAEVTILCRIEDVAAYLKREDLADIQARVQANLVQMSLRSHPLYRNVISDYQETIGRFDATTSEAEAEAALAELVARRTVIQRQAEAVRDHLNWYEATQLDTPSGKFEMFFDALESQGTDARGKRSDPISQYLDALQQEFRQ